MLKGAQKRMIVVKTADNRFFEEAYFVMRSESAATNEDMVSEATRIIDECTDKRRDRARHAAKDILMPICTFIGGSVIGGGIAMAVMLIAG